MNDGTLREQLIEIGDDMAMLSKGHCYDCAIMKKERMVIFYCRNNEKHFVESLSFREIESIHGIKGRILFDNATE